MSSGATQVTDAEVVALQLTFTNTCCQLAAGTLVFHEHMMTIAEEVRYVWGQGLSVATVVFILNRYLVLAFGVTLVLQTLPWDTPLSCEATILLYYVISVLLFTVIAIFSAMRVYAITGCKWQIALVPLGLGLAIVFATVYFTARSSYAYILVINNMPTCDYAEYYSVDAYYHAIIATRTCGILADVFVLSLTLYRTLKTQLSINPGVRMPLTMLLARDGTLYFLTLLLLNILQIVLGSVRGAITNFVAGFFAPISSILISRFMLNLRRVFHLQSSGLNASFIGNSGEPLEHGSHIDHSTSSDSSEFESPWGSSLPILFSSRLSDSLDEEPARISDDVELQSVR